MGSLRAILGTAKEAAARRQMSVVIRADAVAVPLRVLVVLQITDFQADLQNAEVQLLDALDR